MKRTALAPGEPVNDVMSPDPARRRKRSRKKPSPKKGHQSIAVDSARVDRVLPAKKLWVMKARAQDHDHKIATKADLSEGKRLIVSPEDLRAAKVKWRRKFT